MPVGELSRTRCGLCGPQGKNNPPSCRYLTQAHVPWSMRPVGAYTWHDPRQDRMKSIAPWRRADFRTTTGAAFARHQLRQDGLSRTLRSYDGVEIGDVTYTLIGGGARAVPRDEPPNDRPVLVELGYMNAAAGGSGLDREVRKVTTRSREHILDALGHPTTPVCFGVSYCRSSLHGI
ncbi:hypothetical protein Micbo1qcDRAFT_180389 [Microdochium bolleyi]|uniref:Uncharacterized protein n=1 Tax=Microdochium bolleyi TaxID=196109 RepID=A0A136IM51_9PEZI|nr:hypothetical protein Micbo1qcDRAFT_180389 [Microdochium bolleyi]